MERLTEWVGEGAERKAIARQDRRDIGDKDCVARLAAYEDTGLMPEEIKTVQDNLTPIPFSRYREIMEAERAGRLVVPPVKMRDYVYDVDFEKNRIILSKVAAMFVSITEAFPEGVISLTLKAIDGPRPGDMHYVYADDIGETVFLTRKEAEEALREEAENA